MFEILVGKPGCVMTKSKNILFYNQEHELVNGQAVYFPGGFNNLVATDEDLEYLTRFGETLLNTELRETEQSRPTTYDVTRMTSYLQRIGLLTTRFHSIIK